MCFYVYGSECGTKKNHLRYKKKCFICIFAKSFGVCCLSFVLYLENLLALFFGPFSIGLVCLLEICFHLLLQKSIINRFFAFKWEINCKIVLYSLCFFFLSSNFCAFFCELFILSMHSIQIKRIGQLDWENCLKFFYAHCTLQIFEEEPTKKKNIYILNRFTRTYFQRTEQKKNNNNIVFVCR